MARFERFFSYWCYGKVLAPLMPKAGTLADNYEQAVGVVALGNAVGPLTIGGEIKKFLFCPRFGPLKVKRFSGYLMTGAEDQSQKYDQDFFLALALKGKDAWNAWRRDLANKDVHVTFAGIDFSEAPRDEINFAGFEFGDQADFSGCKWRGAKGYAEAFKRGRACFSGAAFGGGASFDGAAFGDWAHFVDAVFGDFAHFDGAAFDDGASFAGAAFGSGASFDGAAFGSGASFTGAAFGDATDFTRALFRGRAEFSGLPYEKWYVAGRAALGRPHRGSKPLYGHGPDRFLTISFLRARFYGEATFSGRTFEGAAEFTEARFYYTPDFDAVTNAARIDFTGASIGFVPPGRRLHWTSDTKVPLRLRTFRKIAEDTKNHDLERDLYIEERKAERGVYLRQRWEELKKAPWIERPLIAWQLIAHLFWILVMLFYWALLLGACKLWPQLPPARRVARFERAILSLALCGDPRAAHAASGHARRGQILARGVDGGAWQSRAFRRPPHHRRRNQKISVLPSLWPVPAHSPGRFSGAGDRPKPLFDHLRVFHRPRVAELL